MADENQRRYYNRYDLEEEGHPLINGGHQVVIIGSEFNFGALYNTLNREQSKSAMGDFFVNIIPISVNYAIVHMIIRSMKEDKLPLTCGIPIIRYVDFALGVMALRAFTLLLKVYIIKYHFTKRLHYELVRLLTVDLATMLCLIYGQVLLMSKQNDCTKNQSTGLLIHVMICTIIFGAFMLGIYFVKECPLLCLQALLQNYFEPVPNYPRRRLRQQQQQQDRMMENNQIQLPVGLNTRFVQDQQIPAVLESLNKESYDMKKFQHETQCIICLNDYLETDVVTQLPCDERHYFHTHCLETWVKNNNNSCPVCRTRIVTIESEQEQQRLLQEERNEDQDEEA